jgi:hypothetical protein
VLTVVPRKSLPRNTDLAHYFVSSRNPSSKSRFGWVQEINPFTFEEFVKQYLGERQPAEEEKDHIVTMLSSIKDLPSGTPVTASYFVRGIIDRRNEFAVHKGIFYGPREK